MSSVILQDKNIATKPNSILITKIVAPLRNDYDDG